MEGPAQDADLSRFTPRCSVYIAASLDGFIARDNGTIDWLELVERADEDYGYAKFFATVDTLVVGRKTYDTVLGFDAWLYEGKRCVVVTSEPSRVSRHGEEFFCGELSTLLARLGRDGSKRVYLDGGTLIGQALRDNLVDELTVSIIPILLGAGTPLAPKLGRDVPLRLVGHRTFPSGLVQLDYVARDARPRNLPESPG